MSGLTLFLAVGLFVCGLHEFEEVRGENKKVWTIQNGHMSHKEFPMICYKLFGYSLAELH
jgi:high-affinity Fe2+/Pb2+ permease